MTVVNNPTPEEVEALVDRFEQGMRFVWMNEPECDKVVGSAVSTLRSCLGDKDTFGWRVIDALAKQAAVLEDTYDPTIQEDVPDDK